jgi:putative SOS response-associated peptidase YedK
MCTRYISPETRDIEQHWHIGARNMPQLVNSWARDMFPGYAGPFLRAAKNSPQTEAELELVVGQWGLIPWFAKERKLKYPTSNARSEELAQKASYKHPWARGQRCIIPALAFFEPNWESGKHVPWCFKQTDGAPWGLAGLFNTWADPSTGELVESYTLLTLNADHHALMSRMHKPDPKRAPHLQDKRSVVPVALADVQTWLTAPLQQAADLLRLAPVGAFDAAPWGQHVPPVADMFASELADAPDGLAASLQDSLQDSLIDHKT